MKKIILLFVLLLVSSVLYAQEKTYSSSDPDISASLGENFNITLSSNHTTGYSWSVGIISDNAQVIITGMDYDVAPNPKVGEGGDEVWHLKAVSSGNAKIIFYYARSWEKEKPTKEVSFNVNVK